MQQLDGLQGGPIGHKALDRQRAIRLGLRRQLDLQPRELHGVIEGRHAVLYRRPPHVTNAYAGQPRSLRPGAIPRSDSVLSVPP